MNLKRISGLLMFSLWISSGALGQKLYPVQGPLASQTQQPVFTAESGAPFLRRVRNSSCSNPGRWPMERS
jgi:hypothetical protein